MSFAPGSTPQQPYGTPGAHPPAQQPHAYGRPMYAPPPVSPPHAALPPVPTQGRSVALWLFAVLGVALLAVVAYFTTYLGTAASVIAFIMALIPLAIVFSGTFLVDRWDREPWSLIIFAVLWGGIAAIVIALLTDLFLSALLPETELRGIVRTVVQAPIVEEIAKGVGLLIIYAVGRRAFDGPVDGVVYGMLVAGGFAFTENIQYFAIEINSGQGGLSFVFFMRAVLSPFAHAMFTALTGAAIGFAAQKGRSGNVFGPFLLGLTAAIILHAFWNGSALFGDFLVLYAIVQVPLFVLFIVGIIQLRRAEAKLTRTRLADYAAAGWFTPQEVDMLATRAGRRGALAWAGSLPGDRRPIMKSFIRDAAHLAAMRQRVVSGRDAQAGPEEWALLQRTAAERNALLSR